MLIVCGGRFDETVLSRLGFENFRCTNVDTNEVAGLESNAGSSEDARHLPYADGSYDCVLVHAGLHHIDRPHQALCEMYRIARKLVFFVESNDSFVMRQAVRLKLTVEYEKNAIIDNAGRGGVNGTHIPNYVYRWTKREVEKVIRALDPLREPDLRFFVEWDFYGPRIARRLLNTPLRVLPRPVVATAAALAVKIVNLLAPNQGNIFGALIRKDSAVLQPWVHRDAGGIVTCELSKCS